MIDELDILINGLCDAFSRKLDWGFVHARFIWRPKINKKLTKAQFRARKSSRVLYVPPMPGESDDR